MHHLVVSILSPDLRLCFLYRRRVTGIQETPTAKMCVQLRWAALHLRSIQRLQSTMSPSWGVCGLPEFLPMRSESHSFTELKHTFWFQLLKPLHVWSAIFCELISEGYKLTKLAEQRSSAWELFNDRFAPQPLNNVGVQLIRNGRWRFLTYTNHPPVLC